MSRESKGARHQAVKPAEPPGSPGRGRGLPVSNRRLHSTSGRWRLGLALALVPTLLWGFLPLALKVVLARMDPYTITWYRFLVAAMVMAVLVPARYGRSFLEAVRKAPRGLILVAVMGLLSNYVCYLVGLSFSSPSVTQVVVQLAPLFLLFGGLVVYREPFSRRQGLGVLVLICGLGLFFNDRVGEFLAGLSGLRTGVFFVVLAAVSWGIYALAQKQLLEFLPSEVIMSLIYLSGSLVFFPMSAPTQIQLLDRVQMLLLGFCALNTLVAYGAFAEALNHVEASRVSMVLATTPLITVAAMAVLAPCFPEWLPREDLNALSVVGALLVVTGSILATLGQGAGGK